MGESLNEQKHQPKLDAERVHRDISKLSAVRLYSGARAFNFAREICDQLSPNKNTAVGVASSGYSMCVCTTKHAVGGLPELEAN